MNLGLIGCGRMGSQLARRCVDLGQSIVAAADPDPAALESAVELFGAEPFATDRELCARAEVDAVIVASIPSAHHANVMAAAATRKPVFCEKPLGVTVGQCDEMIAACSQSGVPLFVGQVLRLFPRFAKSHALVSEGRIGEPRAVSVARVGISSQFASGWRTRKAEAGGLLLEINAHELDYMRWMLGRPVEVFANLDNLLGRMDYEDQAYAIFTFESGATGMLHSSLSSPLSGYRVHIQGTAGSMEHGGFGGTLRYQPVDGEVEEVDVDAEGYPNPYDAELKSWIESLDSGARPIFTGEDGRWPVAMAEAAYLSAERGEPVRVDEILAR